MSVRERRVFSGAQLVIGIGTLARPRRLVETSTPSGSVVPDIRIVRVLGARQAVQGALGLVRPDVEVIRLGAIVDTLHALSLVPLVVASSRYRASALASAGLATAAAGVGFRLTRT